MVYFTPFTRVLFAFPSRYWFTIGRSGVFSLGGWSPHVQTGFPVPRPTHFSSFRPFRIQGCHLLWPVFPDCFARTGTTFGLLPVRSSDRKSVVWGKRVYVRLNLGVRR